MFIHVKITGNSQKCRIFCTSYIYFLNNQICFTLFFSSKVVDFDYMYYIIWTSNAL